MKEGERRRGSRHQWQYWHSESSRFKHLTLSRDMGVGFPLVQSRKGSHCKQTFCVIVLATTTHVGRSPSCLIVSILLSASNSRIWSATAIKQSNDGKRRRHSTKEYHILDVDGGSGTEGLVDGLMSSEHDLVDLATFSFSPDLHYLQKTMDSCSSSSSRLFAFVL